MFLLQRVRGCPEQATGRSMKVWSWNGRGIKSDVNPTISFISSIIRSLSVDVVFLLNQSVQPQCWKRQFLS